MQGLGYVQAIILKELCHGAKSKNYLIDQTGFPNSTITNCLKALEKKEMIKKNKHTYELCS